MIVVKVELHSAITGDVTEIGRMVVANDGTGTGSLGNYDAKLGRKGVADNRKIWESPQRQARVEGYPRISAPVWVLVARALKGFGFK